MCPSAYVHAQYKVYVSVLAYLYAHTHTHMHTHTHTYAHMHMHAHIAPSALIHFSNSTVVYLILTLWLASFLTTFPRTDTRTSLHVRKINEHGIIE